MEVVSRHAEVGVTWWLESVAPYRSGKGFGEPWDLEALRERSHSVDSAFKAELREHFEDAEIAELGLMISQYIALGRLLVIAGADKGASEIYVPSY